MVHPPVRPQCLVEQAHPANSDAAAGEAVVVVQLRAGIHRPHLEPEYPRLSATVFDAAEMQAHLPWPAARPRPNPDWPGGASRDLSWGSRREAFLGGRFPLSR
jgi:hypothetical protein